MSTYQIGNWLRGHYDFDADDDPSAWETGGTIFAEHFPSESRSDGKGRFVQLYRRDTHPVVNVETGEARARESWVLIAEGPTDRPYPHGG